MSGRERRITDDEINEALEEMVAEGRIERFVNPETGKEEIRLTKKGVSVVRRIAPVEIEPELSKYDASIVVQALGILANIAIRDGCDRATTLLIEDAVASGSAVIEAVLSPAQIEEINEHTLSMKFAREAANRQSLN